MAPPSAAAQPARTRGISPLLRPVARRALAGRLDARAWGRLRLLIDLLVLSVAASAALFAAPTAIVGRERVLAAAFPLLTLMILYVRGDPDERLHRSAFDASTHIVGVASLAAMLTIAASEILGAAHPLGLALRLWLFAVVYLGCTRVVLLSVRRALRRSPRLATPTLIVGAGLVGEHLVKRFVDDRSYGLLPVGFLDSDPLPRSTGSGALVPVLGGPSELAGALAQTGARQVILAFTSEPDRVLVECVSDCQRLGIEVSLVPRLFESINERATLDYVGGLPLLTLHPTNPRGWQFALKHAFDRSSAFIGLVLLAPLMATIAVAVRLSSPGPVLFRQRRVGRDGHAVDVFKFRTMREPRTPSRFELPHGVAPGGVEGIDRRTAVGRFLRDSSLDELPQLINVLRGEMSVVGPRPERPEYVERFSLEVARYGDRHRVKSGITGWAQVNGLRGQTSIADRVEWDNFYIQNWSLRLDLKILALTVYEVLRGAGER